MKRIGIASAGISGLTLALRLQQLGVETVLYTDRSPEQVRAGRLLNRVQGELLMEAAGADAALASLELARDIAHRQHAVLLERRAEASLAQLLGANR